MGRRQQDFQTIRSEGGLLPMDLLRRILDPKDNLSGTKPEDYGLPKGDRINEAITQSWNRLQRHWTEFRDQAERLTEGTTGTGLTNEKWNLPILRELGFGFLPTVLAPEINGQTYAISRFHGPAAIHLVGCRLSLDKRAAGARGAASQNPHGLVQEFLNRSDEHLWAILSNGMTLRILRDNEALSRQSYLEFDLEAMFEGEIYSDFVLLWLIGHATRFSIKEGERPEGCWLEQWTRIAEEQGTRALESLQGGVEKALQTLGQGFVSHPRNTQLREQLREGSLSLTDLHSQLLRVVYRLIFLFVSEDRQLDGIPVLHPRSNDPNEFKKRERYTKYYSLGRLRDLASGIRGSRHGDLWHQFNLVVGALSGEEAFDSIRGNLNLPILGSFLWDPVSTQHLNTYETSNGQGIELSNSDFLEAIRNLAYIHEGKILRPVDYKNLGSEELGGVYESLLALTPQISGDGTRFTFAEFAGSERKLSGSYYTPDSLVQCLLDSALDPVVEKAIEGKKGQEAEQALLSLAICDPAVGSGHFLVGAAHRMARQLARIRAWDNGESEPSPNSYQTALRDIIGHCLYGVDINPMAAELCRVSLWLEALEPGKPLSFLDYHIQVGNSLLGTTLTLLDKGIPAAAFKPTERDNKKICSLYAKRNIVERKHKGMQGELELQKVSESIGDFNSILSLAQDINQLPDESIKDIQTKSQRLNILKSMDLYQHTSLSADAWCAAFLLRKAEEFPNLITESVYRMIERNQFSGTDWLLNEIKRISHEYQLFHWHISFPEIFAKGGFDCILSNPPWEKINLRDEEFFATSYPDIVSATTKSKRKIMIEELSDSDPTTYNAYIAEQDKHDRISHFLRHSEMYPLTGLSRINLYSTFSELSSDIINSRGQFGLVLPSGIITDNNNKNFYQSLISNERLRSAFDFENREGIFPGVHRQYRFCLLTISGKLLNASSSRYAFYLQSVNDLDDSERFFSLTQKDIGQINPMSKTCPVFRSRYEASIAKIIYSRIIPWCKNDGTSKGKPRTPFNTANDSQYFLPTDKVLGDSPKSIGAGGFEFNNEPACSLYESKLIHAYDHRYATFLDNEKGEQLLDARKTSSECKSDPNCTTFGRHWLAKSFLNQRFPGKWFFVYRDITNATNERTSIAAIIPARPAANSLSIIDGVSAPEACLLLVNMNSFVYDFIARTEVAGLHLSHFIWKQLPYVDEKLIAKIKLPQLLGLDVLGLIIHGSLELSYTEWGLKNFAGECSWFGPPFIWNEERRFKIKCELDALFFHAYLPSDINGHWYLEESENSEKYPDLKKIFPNPRDALIYIMDTFPITRRKDENTFSGNYHTKQFILEIYDAMQEAIHTGVPYTSRLDPPPGPPADPLPEWILGQPRPKNWPVHIHPPKGVTY